jgi:Leucine-rich repeat (LRR) protein
MSSDQRAQYERKLARQRQMEMMEAAASGSVPSMELDTALAESQLRSRTEEARLLQQQQQSQQPQPRESGMRATQLFERPELVRPSVNLMDHDTGIYQEPTTLRQHVGSLFRGLITQAEFDASPSDDYIGQKPRRRKGRAKNLTAQCIVVCQRHRTLCGMMFMVVLIGIIMTTTVSYIKARPEKIMIQNNMERHKQMEELIVSQGMSHPESFMNANTAEYHAIRWLAYSDPMRLPINDPYLLQRYALAVFYYGSYFSFQQRAGTQQFEQRDFLVEGVPNPGWTRSDNWLTGKGYCSWHGIECKAREEGGKTILQYDDNADIITLDMDHNQVMGSLPMEFKSLDHLQFLDMAGNKLTGPFPYQIARIFSLQHLLLNNNALTGTLPTWMGQLESIKELRFGHNQFRGTLPTELNRLLFIKVLAMEYNQITGNIPILNNLKRVADVNFDNNLLSGTIPDELAFMRELQTIRLSNNKLTGTFPVEFNNIASLRALDVSHNTLNGTLRDFLFERLTNLRVIDFQHNQLSGTIPTPIGFLKHVEEVYFNNNNFTGPMPIWKEAYNLRKVHVQENRIDGYLPKGFCKLNNMEELWMNDNQFFGPVHPQWGNLTKLLNLQLENNMLTGTLPPQLEGLTSLESLRIQGNNMTGTMAPEVCSLKKTASLRSIVVDCSLECDCCGYCHNV